MSKKARYTAFLFALIASSPGLGRAVEKSYLTQGQFRNSISTVMMRIDMDGNILPGRNLTTDLGESTHSWRDVYAQRLVVSSGIINVTETFASLSSGVARGATPSGVLIPTTSLITTLVNSPTTYIDMNISQPTGAPRNLICFSSGLINPTTSTLMMSATFYGYDGRGNNILENIIFSTTPISWSTTTTVYSTEVARAVGVGQKAFAYISSFTVQITSMTDAWGLSTESPAMYFGFGQIIGLSNNILATSDVYKITVQGGSDVTNSTLNPLVSVNTANDTIIFSPLPSGSDRKVWYKVKNSN